MKISAAPEPLENLDAQTRKPPETRIRDTQSARSLWSTLRDDDDDADYDRSVVQRMFDGDPPYDSDELKQLGQGYRANFNLGNGAAMLEDSLTGYNDLTNSVDLMATFRIGGGDPLMNAEWERILAEEFHSLHNDDWPGYEYQKQLLNHYFVGQGVGIAYFDHTMDWRWRATSLQHFKLPRQIPADENVVEVAACEREYQISELWRYIRDPKGAKLAGWNVEAVKEAILNATERKSEGGEWERFQAEIKGNDLGAGASIRKTISTIHMWNREFDGTITFRIFARDGLTDSGTQGSTNSPVSDDFLFVKKGAYKVPQDAFILFTYGIGSNGLLHSIRGLGYKILDQEQINNRLACQAVDSTFMASSLMVQPKTASDVVDGSLVYQGPLAVLPANLNVIKDGYPSRVEAVLPVINFLSVNAQNRVGSYRVRQSDQSGGPITAREAEIREQREATLSQGAINIYYKPLKRLYNAVARRLFARGYREEDPGGREAVEFKRRCLGRGVPEEVFHGTLFVEPVRAVGYGSPSMRRIINRELTGMLQQVPELGRNNILRDHIASLVGTAQVDRYLPRMESVSAVPVDAKLAELENAHIQGGQQVSVRPGENHAVHVMVHLPILAQFAQAARNGQEVSPDALPFLLLMSEHLVGHLAPIGGDETRRELVMGAKKIIQEVQELTVNLGRKVTAMRRREAEEQQALAQQGPPQEQPIDPLQMAKTRAVEVETQLKLVKAQADLKVMQDKAERERIKDDLKAAALVPQPGGA